MDEESDAPPRPKRLFRKRWMTAACVTALAGGLWTAREPIADRFIRDQLDGRDVPARYTIEDIGFRTERLRNVVIGDPARPDLTADFVEITLGYGFSGPYVSAIRADGVRLYGRFADGQLSLGALDRFRDPTDTTPFALPDLSVRLADARARIETPWGDVGAALNGGGNLRRDFVGELALVAPALDAAGCRASNATFYGSVSVRDARPRFKGPLRGEAFACGGDVRVLSPQVALDLSLDDRFRKWRGSADASIGGLSAGPVAADRAALDAQFEGSADRTAFSFDVTMARPRGGDFSARSVTIEAKASIGKEAPSATGQVRFAGARASPVFRRAMIEQANAANGSPLGPVATKAAAALAAMLADVDGSTRFAFSGDGSTRRLDLMVPGFASASGARLAGSDASRLAIAFGAGRPMLLVDGDWRFGGGGLPSGELRFERTADGASSGVARFDSYSAGDARLTLDPVHFSAPAGGSMRFVTRARLTGPLADGRIEGLAVPLAGAIAPSGAIALDGGCSRIGFDRLSVAGYRFGRSAVDLCSRPNAALLGVGPAGLRGSIRVPRIALRGTDGNARISLVAGASGIDLATMRWTLADADVRLGEGDAMTRFAADAIRGRVSSGGAAGSISGAQARIAAVPLNMTEIAGDWRWNRGGLTLDGGLVLTDAAADARFAPLVSHDAQLRYAEGAIDATAGFDERRSGTKILDAVIRHDLATGVGHADLTVDELRFGDRFQPDQLTPLALGVVANVQGSVVGDGRIDWTPQGVTSHGTFATANANLAAAFGPVTGLTTTLRFDDLIDLRSAPGQTATVAEINPGIPVIDGTIEYSLLGDNRIRVEGGRWPFAGGELVLHPATLDFNAAQPRRLSFDIVGVDAAVFLQQFGFENINATGKFDGTLPVEFGGLGGRIVGGRIDARQGGGTLAYVGELSNHNLGAMANFAFGALRSLKYDDLTVLLNGDLDGEMVTDIRFGGVGQGEGATRNFLTRQVASLPLVFNVKIHAPFRQLITSAKGFYDPTILIEQNLPTLLRVQEQVDAAKTGAQAPVQPTESESMP